MSNTNVVPLTNDLSVAPRKPRTIRRGGRRARQRRINWLERHLTTVLGVGIPALSVALSRVAGSLWVGGHHILALAAGALVICVLSVSLAHVARAIRELSGAEPWLSWALALSLDAGLVVSEIASVTTDAERLTCTAIVVSVVVVSAALNVFAFQLVQQERIKS